MRIPFFQSLRFRLLIIVAIIAVPTLIISIAGFFVERAIWYSRAEENAQRALETIRDVYIQRIEQSRAFLTTLAHVSVVQEAHDNLDACNTFFAQLLREQTIYKNIGIVDTQDGIVFCSGLSQEMSTYDVDHPWLTRVVENDDFAVGDYRIDRITGRTTINFVYPLLRDGVSDALLFVTLDLETVSAFSLVDFPEWATVFVVDALGKVVIGYPEPEQWIGVSVADKPLFQTVRASQDGTAKMQGFDGREYYFVFAPLKDFSVIIGMPSNLLFSELNLLFYLAISILGIIFFVCGVLSWHWGRLWVVRNLDSILERLRQFSKGERNGSLSQGPDTGEFGEINRAITKMAYGLLDAKALAEKDRLLGEAILTSISEGVVVVNDRGKIEFMNRAAEMMLKSKTKEARGKRWGVDMPVVLDSNGASMESAKTIVSQVLETGLRMKQSCIYQTEDKKQLSVIAIATPVVLQEKKIGVVIVFRDQTQEVEIEQRRSEFITILSHQLRSPLTAMQWVAEVFLEKEKRISKRGHAYLNDIRTSVYRLSRLVDALLSASRLENEKVSIIPQELNVIHFMKNLLKEYYPLCDMKKIHLSFTHPDEMRIVTDRGAFRSIVQSLISNAVEYTSEGGSVTITLTQEDDTIMLVVKDTGIGIPVTEQGKIFERFYRASNARRERPTGTGLGLYIAKEATKLLGGSIRFDSEEGKGVEFFVKLPVQSKPKEGNKSFT